MEKLRSEFSFATRLRSLREERRLSKTALSKLVGVSTTCVWNWEEGNTEPRWENLVALGDALKVSPEYLERGRGLFRGDKADASSSSTEVEQLNLAEVIADAKVKIARLAGTRPDKVSISIEY